MRLKDKVAIVTGGAKGLGRAFAVKMAEEGARVMVVTRKDMDNLKEVNRLYGHSMGSRTLYEVSVRVRARIRKFDKLFRYGGDEFCIVLPETEWHGALEVAERVRDEIAGKPFLVRELGDAGTRMTASLGVAPLSPPVSGRASVTWKK